MMPRVARSEVSVIEVEAAAWIAQLDSGRFSDEDKVALREWCARSELHRDALRRLGALWSELDGLGELQDQLTQRAASQARPAAPRWNSFWAAHAAAVLLVVTGWLLWRGGLLSSDETGQPVQMYATQLGELKTIRLDDQSSARLNTDTLVEIDYRPHERRVRLVKGEGLFEVAKDPNRPFVVYAAASKVRALGTRFAVRVENDNVEVVVSEGVVELTRAAAGGSGPARPVRISRLEPQQRARIDAAVAAPVSIETIDLGELERRLSWTTGVLEFDGEPLEKVISEVSRYTPLRIQIGDPALRNVPVGGRFRVGETKALFDALENGFGATVTRDGDVVTITSNTQ